MEGIEEIVSSVIRRIYYQLNLSHSDFAKCSTHYL